ncbi:uncharacterized protein LOC128745869 [Sabethes cyaneus]|uniref:uncharacterized protein LOC128745869 n=1 Tax=Sabethes cyaneus TaxID=53552 RepID=UPI00237E6AF6|nr:uncharacterized protein LOC128745869 [Sabethes cyaneus]
MGHRLKDCRTFKSYSVDGRCRFVQQQGICRNCLNAHGRRSCRSSGVCGVNGCQYRHHPLLHFPRSVVSAAENHTHRIIPVTVHGGGKSICTYAFLDDGSSITLIEDGLVKQLGVDGEEQPLCLKWTGNMSRVENKSRTVCLSLSRDGQRHYELRNVRTVKELTLPSQSVDVERLSRDYPHLRGIPVQGYESATPRLLVGIDNIRLTVPLKTREGGVNDPVAVKTRLGWCIYEGQAETPRTTSLNLHACDCSSDQNLHDMVKEFFTLEDIGTRSTEPMMSDEERRALDLLKLTTKRVGDRYETGLLWRFDDVKLPDSYGMAMKRLDCLERSMKRKPLLKEKLTKQINGYLAKGYVRRATTQDLEQADNKRVWYLPIGVMFNPKKPDKMRMIWDAAAKVRGISLNDMLLKGPDQLASLPAVLLRYRQFAFAVIADIAEMFHQILIREVDRHAQRFLWRSNPFEAPEVFLMNVATFGSKCSPASAQFVKNQNAMEFAEEYPRGVECIVKNHYIDDLLESFGSAEEAARVMQAVRAIHSKGGFNIRNFQSNSSGVLNSLGEKEESEVRCLGSPTEDKCERVLGLLWHPQEDLLGFSMLMQPEIQIVITSGAPPTKRQVLKCLMSFFDPIGLLSTFTVQGKILLQAIWKSGINWDQTVSKACHDRWRKWMQLLKDVQHLRIPRCYFLGASVSRYQYVELHVFVDASEDAFAAVAYFRTVDQKGKVECSLAAAKSKVAPIKPMSIPRLELRAAVLGVRLVQFVTEGHSIQITKRVFWSDSTTVLSWINSHERRYKQFVAVRAGDILTETNADEWSYVPTKKNIADTATKWGKGPELKADSEWFRGPKFIWCNEDQWPAKFESRIEDGGEELRSIFVHQEVAKTQLVVDLERFSNWNRALRATAYTHRFIGNTRAAVNRKQLTFGSLTQAELTHALEYLIRSVQWEVFSAEVDVLKQNQQLPVESQEPLGRCSSIYQLSPMIDERGILRVDSRIQAANVARNTKFPAILPQKHRLTSRSSSTLSIGNTIMEIRKP